MSVALPRVPALRAAGLDASAPVLAGLGLFLCALVVLPLGWLVWYAVTDENGVPTLGNFVRLAGDPSFAGPYLTAAGIALCVALGAAAAATPLAWLVARTDMPLRRTIRALVTASFVTPPFLGAIAWETLAAPNSGLFNQWCRALFGLGEYEHVFNIYSAGGLVFVMACYAFPYTFVLIANALDRMPGDLEDASAILGGSAWTTARRITVPLAMPALLAGALIAFLQAMTLFGSPAILALPAGFHTMTTKIWSLFQYPPKLELAAAASLPLLGLTVALLRAEAMILGRRGYSVVGGRGGEPRRIALGRWKWAALAAVLLALANPVFLPYGALLNAAFSRIPSEFVSFENLTLRNFAFVFFELSST